MGRKAITQMGPQDVRQSLPTQNSYGLEGEKSFREALKRVGVGLKKNAQWFLKWCQQDMLSLSASERVSLWLDLLALSLLAGRTSTDKLDEPIKDKERKVWDWAARWADHFRTPSKSQIHKDWWAAIRNLQRTIYVSQQELADSGRARIRFGQDLDIEVTPEGIHPVFAPTFRNSFAWGDLIRLSQGAHLRFLQVLQHFPGHIHRCPRCRILFFAARLDRVYCSSNCRMVIGMRQYRERHREELLSKRRRVPEHNASEGRASTKSRFANLSE